MERMVEHAYQAVKEEVKLFLVQSLQKVYDEQRPVALPSPFPSFRALSHSSWSLMLRLVPFLFIVFSFTDSSCLFLSTSSSFCYVVHLLRNSQCTPCKPHALMDNQAMDHVFENGHNDHDERTMHE